MIWRYRLTLFFLFSAFFLIITRLFYWQVVKAEEFSELGQSQYGKLIKVTPKRGEIKTSDGYSIVANKLTYLVFANPKQMKDKLQVEDALVSMLGIDKASVSASLALDKFWVPIKIVDSDTKEALAQRKLSSIGFEEVYSRLYPEASMSAQLIGFVGKDDLGDDKGYFGLEGYYDRQLRGKPGIVAQVQDVFGRPILAKVNEKTKGIDGRNLVLSIDRVIQFNVEKVLKDGVEKYGADSGMIGIMNPKTGEIIAMASYPSFDPADFQHFDDDLYKNPFITNVYEPGSTFKAMVMAGGIDAQVIKPETKCPICAGPISIGEYQIRTWNNQYEKDMSMIDVLRHSDNTGMVYVGKSLGENKLLEYLNKFGIGEPTGIDLQGETNIPLKNPSELYAIDLATLTFGQGVSITPIQLLSGISAIANGGVRMQPHVVKQIETLDGDVIDIPSKVVSAPISSVTAKIMTEMMVNAVDHGESQWTRAKGYRVAGKTGTAQIPINGHYDPNKTIASFVGFAPADDPKFVMLVIIDRPTSSIYGAETAAPVFFDVAKKIFDYYQIPPTVSE